MTGRFQIDHVVIKVTDLDRAMADYEALGFSVVRGGEHPMWGSRNALVCFADGSYLELIAYGAGMPKEGLSRHEARMLSRAQVSDGLVDYAVLPEHIERDLNVLREHGLDYEGPLPGGRMRPDGQEVRWEMGLPDGRDLPFLCGDVTPRHLRVPEGEIREHENGALGIVEVGVAVKDLDVSAGRYGVLLGVRPNRLDSGTVCFSCGQVRVVLSAPTDEAVREHLTERGVGPWRVGLATRLAEAETVDVGLAHGARIEFVSGN
ncbi:MAG: VOC family protein [bacterium]|nr:VOC family protein [bacterium]